MRNLFIIFILILLTAPALATTSIDSKDIRDQLLKQLQTAQTADEGRKAEEAIRLFWLRGPNITLTSKMLTAIQARRHYHFEKGIRMLDEVIASAPEYAEAYNQRAFLYFLQKKFDKALLDLDKTLEYEPRHFGALTGKAIIFLHQGHMKQAREALIQAIKIHPWLREREFLKRIPAS